jgi:Patatin-like phospholipase
VFRNDPGATSRGMKVVDAALATSAAPYFLNPHATDERLYADGGLVANSPEALAAAGTRIRLESSPKVRSANAFFSMTSSAERACLSLNTPSGLAKQFWTDSLDHVGQRSCRKALSKSEGEQALPGLAGPGREPDKGPDLSTVERTEFRQLGDQGPGDCRSDAGHGSEEILFLDPDGRFAYLIVNQAVQLREFFLQRPLASRSSSLSSPLPAS